MDREGRAAAPAAGTILNALATGTGAAFAIDRDIRATVRLDDRDEVDGTIPADPTMDPTLIERCVERTLTAVGATDMGGTVSTESDIPPAAGLKSSSAAANATVLATLDALGDSEELDRTAATRVGVAAARDVGVTITGAFDDASASMLGGVTITDNDEDTLLHRETVDWHVAVWTPDEQSYSADAPVDRCRTIAPVAELVEETALNGAFETAMTVNGFAFCAALDRSAEPMMEALPDSRGVSLSGTGPSFTAVGEAEAIRAVKDRWADRSGSAWMTTTQSTGATVL